MRLWLEKKVLSEHCVGHLELRWKDDSARDLFQNYVRKTLSFIVEANK